MKKFALTAIASAALLVPAAPAVAGNADHPDQAKGPKAEKVSKAKAYGKYCQGQSKKHVKGVKGTPFSRCVVGVAQMRKDEDTTQA